MINFAILFLCIGTRVRHKMNLKIFLRISKEYLDCLFQNNPFLVVVIGEFNVNWYYHDKSSSEGNAVGTIIKQYVLHQVIKEPTYILGNSSTCIDLIFSSQSNLITDSGVHPSLYPNCHHQIVYAKFNLQIHFSPPYSREV